MIKAALEHLVSPATLSLLSLQRKSRNILERESKGNKVSNHRPDYSDDDQLAEIDSDQALSDISYDDFKRRL